jgi:TPR repeat protein
VLAAALALLIASGKPPAKRPAVEALQKACDAEDARACAELSRRYRAGDGVPRDLARSVEAARDGCEAGEPALCVEAGRALLRGEGVKPDPQLARELFGDACTERTQAGCLDLALMFQNGTGVAKDPKTAVPLFDKACQGGDAFACSLLGDALYGGIGTARDPRAAQGSFERACELELFSGCTKLGDLLRLQRDAGAAELYRKACAAEETDACTILVLDKGCAGREGCLEMADLCSDYLVGYDVLAEPQLAIDPCEKACAGGAGEACDNLADMYEEGYGVPSDHRQAALFRKRACELGDRDACAVRE